MDANKCSCDKIVTNKDNGLLCDGCTKWFHAGCQKVSLELYRALAKNKDELWFCRPCKLEVRGSFDKIRKLEEQNSELKDRVKALEDKWVDIRDEIVAEAKDRIMKELNPKHLAETVVNQVKERSEEEEDRDKRKNNLVIYNMKESQDENPIEREKEDENECGNLFVESLKVENFNIVKVIRLGKRGEGTNGAPRPLLVKLDSEHEKWRILKHAKNLKHEEDTERKKIGISRDMTFKERDHEKKTENRTKKKKGTR